MKRSKLIIAILAVAALGIMNTAVASAGSQPSTHYTSVYNHGNNPGDTCSNTLFSYDGVNYTLVGYYVGFQTMVQSGAMRLLQCQMKLVFGPGVGSTLVLNYDGLNQVYTKSGNATFVANF